MAKKAEQPKAAKRSIEQCGQPDVQVRKVTDVDDMGECCVEVCGFDYHDPAGRKIEFGDTSKIVMWVLNTGYDGRSPYPSDVFFPMAGAKDGWSRPGKNRRAEVDEELIEAYRGPVLLPFERGNHKRVAVKIIDDRGIESLKNAEVA